MSHSGERRADRGARGRGAELIAGLVAGAPSAVIAIGDLVNSVQPPGAKDLMVQLFGTNDKLALNVAVVAGAVVIAAAVGVLARRRWAMGVLGFSHAGALALGAVLRQPLTPPLLGALTITFAVAAGLAVLRLLLIPTRPARAQARVTLPPDAARAAAMRAIPDWDRRGFLICSGSVAVASIVAGIVGRNLLQAHAEAPITTGSLPPAASAGAGTAPWPGPTPIPISPGAQIDVSGITPIVTPKEQFYQIDTTIVPPRVDVSTWKVTVTGMVEKEVSLAYDQLTAMPLFRQWVTIACVSNEVGGHLVGNALWEGVHLRDVLKLAGVKPGATQIVGRSVDRFTVGFPTEWAMDHSRDPMIALGMDGQVLPVGHGYPARLIVPGLYGYVSAMKWLSEIEFTTLEAFDAFWVPLGWAKEAPILTQSRIDVPRALAKLPTGPVTVAGVAWAPDRGVSKVEIRVDDGDWLPATLSTPLSRASWIQWKVDWTSTPGQHAMGGS